jgi:hypothetical protein
MVATAIVAGLDNLGLTDPWRACALEVAHWELLGESGDAQGDEPRPPDDPVVMEYDVRPSNAPAIEAVPSPVPACRRSTTSRLWTMTPCVFSEAGCSTSWNDGTCARDRHPRPVTSTIARRPRRRNRRQRGPGGCCQP